MNDDFEIIDYPPYSMVVRWEHFPCGKKGWGWTIFAPDIQYLKQSKTRKPRVKAWRTQYCTLIIIIK